MYSINKKLWIVFHGFFLLFHSTEWIFFSFLLLYFTFGKEISSWPYLSSHLSIIMKFYPHILCIVSSWFLWHTCEIECREHSFLEMVEWQLNRIQNLTNVGDRGIISALNFPAHIILKKSPSLKSQCVNPTQSGWQEGQLPLLLSFLDLDRQLCTTGLLMLSGILIWK